LATKDKKAATKKAPDASHVTRIKATDSVKPDKETAKAAVKTASERASKTSRFRNPFGPIGGYFAGAWYELKQVRWPNRKATWSMTAAMLAFTSFFVVLVLLLDALFKYLFDIILG